MSNVNAVSGQTTVKGGKNNPAFLIVSNNQWQGKETPVQGQKFENFKTFEMGVRAAAKNIITHLSRNGGNMTINQLIDSQTPAIAENPENARINYKNFVQQKLNSTIVNRQNLHTYLNAVFQFENNKDFQATLHTANYVNAILAKYDL